MYFVNLGAILFLQGIELDYYDLAVINESFPEVQL